MLVEKLLEKQKMELLILTMSKAENMIPKGSLTLAAKTVVSLFDMTDRFCISDEIS